MTEEKFIHTNLKNELTHDFLVEILKHYHYEQKDMEMLKEVAGELRECLAGEELKDSHPNIHIRIVAQHFGKC